MPVQRMEHVGIVVEDLKATVAFEARIEERHVGQILEMFEELGIDDSGAESGTDR